MTQQTFIHTTTRKYIKTQAEYNDLLLNVKNVAQGEKEKFQSNIKAMRIIRFARKTKNINRRRSCLETLGTTVTTAMVRTILLKNG